MTFTTLLDTATLAAHLPDPGWVVFDCRFDLTDTDAGRRDYAAEHIPGALYAHLNEDLSSPITRHSGRHPLPSPALLAEKLGRWGVDKHKQVAVYDEASGAIAARLWWLLRWLGHDAVAVLDGGLRKWALEGKPLTDNQPQAEPTQFHPVIDDGVWVDTAYVEQVVAAGGALMLDARAPERFRGEVEPLDKLPGHIPGARNAPFTGNLESSGIFRAPTALRARFEKYLSEASPNQVVHMCGSGVTACHNILAMEHAGLRGAKLYAGSWSEWIASADRPIAKGA